MVIITLTVGPLQVNCYLVGCERTREAALIDPGDDEEFIMERVQREKWRVKKILLTHGHVDHLGAVAEVRDATGGCIMMGCGDESLIKGATIQARMFGLRPPQSFRIDRYLKDGEGVAIGELRGMVIATPGHSPGSVCYAFPDALFAGDTLFQASIGRTDLPGGSTAQLLNSIKTRLFTLPDEVIVHPGHGAPTTVGDEKRYNPYFIA